MRNRMTAFVLYLPVL